MLSTPRSASAISQGRELSLPRTRNNFLTAQPISTRTDSTPLNEAENYSEFKIHASGCAEVWKKFKREGLVPADLEYDEVPRGRVAYNAKTKTYLLLADRCILKDAVLVNQTKAKMNLGDESIKADTDEHYGCPGCMS